MWFKNLVRFWTNWKERKQGKRRRKNSKPSGRWARALLNVEPLEDRAVPATFTVTTLTDEINFTGNVSLREALYYANNNNNSTGTTDVINFSAAIQPGTIHISGAYGDLYIAENVRIEASNFIGV